MKGNKLKNFEIMAFIYFFVGTVCALIARSGSSSGVVNIVIICFLAFFLVPIIYLVFDCILYKHRNYLMNVIDSILCFALTSPYPFSFFGYIYYFDKHLYYFLGGCFSVIPIIFGIIDKEKISLFHVLRTITRIFMLIFVILIILFMNSCSSLSPSSS